jgi:hypothetical protein
MLDTTDTSPDNDGRDSHYKMTTPKQLTKFATSRGWSYERLARAVSDAAGYTVSTGAIFKFCTGRTKPQRLVRNAIETFMSAQTVQKAS